MSDLQLLGITAMFAWAQLIVAAQLRSRAAGGMTWSLGNRDTQPELGPLAGRADRAARNMLENLPIFTALLLAAHLMGHAPGHLLLGAEIFVAMRVVYWLVYLAGVAYVRSLVWTASLLGLALIASTLF